jgi:cation transport regulator ChaB
VPAAKDRRDDAIRDSCMVNVLAWSVGEEEEEEEEAEKAVS